MPDNEEDLVAISMKNGDHPRSTWEERAPDLLKGWGGDRWNCRRKLFRTIHELFRYRDELKVSPDTKEADFNAVTNVICYYQYVIDVNDGNGKCPLKHKTVHGCSELFAADEERSENHFKVLGKPKMGITGGGKLSSHVHHHGDADAGGKDDTKETTDESPVENEDATAGKNEPASKDEDGKENEKDSSTASNTTTSQLPKKDEGNAKNETEQKDEKKAPESKEESKEMMTATKARAKSKSPKKSEAPSPKQVSPRKKKNSTDEEPKPADNKKTNEVKTAAKPFSEVTPSPKKSAAQSSGKGKGKTRKYTKKNASSSDPKGKAKNEDKTIEEMDEEEFFYYQHNSKCEVCSDGGNLICCSTCNLVFHQECARPKLYTEPPDNWSCAYCHASGLTGWKYESRERQRNIRARRQMEKLQQELQARAEEEEAPADNEAESEAGSEAQLGVDSNKEEEQQETNTEGENAQHRKRKNPSFNDSLSPDTDPRSSHGRPKRSRKQPELYDGLIVTQINPPIEKKKEREKRMDLSIEKKEEMEKRMKKARDARLAKIHGRKRKAYRGAETKRKVKDEEEKKSPIKDEPKETDEEKPKKVKEVEAEVEAKAKETAHNRELSNLFDSLSPDINNTNIYGHTQRSRKPASHFGSKAEMDPLELEFMAKQELKAENRRKKYKRRKQAQRQEKLQINDEEVEKQQTKVGEVEHQELKVEKAKKQQTKGTKVKKQQTKVTKVKEQQTSFTKVKKQPTKVTKVKKEQIKAEEMEMESEAKEHQDKDSAEKDTYEKEGPTKESQGNEHCEHNISSEARLSPYRDSIPREIETSDLIEAQSEKSMNQPTFSDASQPLAGAALSKSLTSATTRQLCEWLVKRGISSGTLDVFWREEIDGTFLFEESLDEVKNALKAEGVKLGQISKIRKAIKEAIKEGSLI